MDYEKFRLQVRDLATKAYKDLKEESKDYGELRQKQKILYRTFIQRQRYGELCQGLF